MCGACEDQLVHVGVLEREHCGSFAANGHHGASADYMLDAWLRTDAKRIQVSANVWWYLFPSDSKLLESSTRRMRWRGMPVEFNHDLTSEIRFTDEYGNVLARLAGWTP
jgi:hypothetical protein